MDRNVNMKSKNPSGSSGVVNALYEDLNFLYPLTGQEFSGYVRLDKAHVIYKSYTVQSDITIQVDRRFNVVSAAYAELILVADGSHTPSFSADFTATPSSDSWDTTSGKIHKIGVYYDGDTIFYTITVLD